MLTVVGSVLASSGFWAWLSRRTSDRSATREMIRGLAHDRVVHVGKGHIRRGYLTLDEYEDFMEYLARPYQKMGGNGLAERVILEIQHLPIYPDYKKDIG
jgi:hypothetical protein